MGMGTRVAPISGAGGDPLTTTNIPAMSILSYSGLNGGVGTMAVESADTHSWPGVVRMIRATKSTTTGQNYGVIPITSCDTLAFRLRINIEALPASGTALIMRALTAGNAIAFTVGITSAGKIDILNASGGSLWTPGAGQTTNFSVDVPCDLLVYTNNGDTDGSWKAILTRNSDSVVMASTTLLTSKDMAAANLTQIRLGASITSSSLAFDGDLVLELEPGATDYLTTWTEEIDPIADGNIDPEDYVFINMSTSVYLGTDTSLTILSVDPDTDASIGTSPSGDPGVWIEDLTGDHDVTVQGNPSNRTDTVTISHTKRVDESEDTSSSKRPTGGNGTNTWA